MRVIQHVECMTWGFSTHEQSQLVWGVKSHGMLYCGFIVVGGGKKRFCVWLWHAPPVALKPMGLSL